MAFTPNPIDNVVCIDMWTLGLSMKSRSSLLLVKAAK